MAKQNRSKSALGGKKKAEKAPRVPKSTKAYIDKAIKRELRRMHISRTDNGKFLVDHEFRSKPGEPSPDMEQYALEPGDLAPHVGEYLGLGAPPVATTAAPELPAAGGVTTPELPLATASPLTAGLPPAAATELPAGLKAPAPTSIVSGV